MYQNIISADIVSYRNYRILSEHESLDAAISSMNADVAAFRKKYGGTPWYKLNYPFAWATIKSDSER